MTGKILKSVSLPTNIKLTWNKNLSLSRFVDDEWARLHASQKPYILELGLQRTLGAGTKRKTTITIDPTTANQVSAFAKKHKGWNFSNFVVGLIKHDRHI